LVNQKANPDYHTGYTYIKLKFAATLNIRTQGNIEVIELIPPGLNTDLGGKGIHDSAPPVSDFIESVFEQLKLGKNEITFGFTEEMNKAGPQELQKAFVRMNRNG
jgi:short-subunit dehydrogenase involved in D-alanine esterification of teichoic acids